MRLAELQRDLRDEARRLLLRHDALVDETASEELADGRMLGDASCHQGLGVGRLVLFVVPVPPVADQVDDDIALESPPERHRQADGGDRCLRIVSVDVDDRDVEALGEIARVARRAALAGIGREADLVVRDQMEGAADRVADQRGEVQRLRDASLSREGRVAVDQDRQRDARVVEARPGGTVGLLGARTTFDHRVDGLEMARIRCKRDGDLARGGRPDSTGAEVVLDVAGAAFLRRDDRLDRPLAFELPDDRVVAQAECVGEDAQSAAMRHADHGLVSPVLGCELDRLVEHRHENVETLDRELLLAQEGAPEVLLERLDTRELAEQCCLLLGRERRPVAPRLDRLAQPDALLVVRDVLDLVGNRPAVRVAQARESVRERLSRYIETENRCRDPPLELGRELGDQAFWLECRVAGRLGAERVEAGREVSVHPVCLDQCGGRGDAAEQLL